MNLGSIFSALSGFLLLSSLTHDVLAYVGFIAFIPYFYSLQQAGRSLLLNSIVFALAFALPIGVGLWPLDITLSLGMGIGASLVMGLWMTAVFFLFPVYESSGFSVKNVWGAILGMALFVYGMELLGIPLHFGIAFYKQVWALKVASWAGIDLVCAAIVFVNILLWHSGRFFNKKSFAFFLVVAVLLIPTYFNSNQTIAGKTLKIGVAQGFPEWRDFSFGWLMPERLERLKNNFDTSLEAMKTNCPDVLIWPENGEGIKLARVQSRQKQIAAVLHQCGAWGFISSIDFDGFKQTNSIFSFDPLGALKDQYNKLFLTPTEKALFKRGDPNKTILQGPNGLKFGALICYESLFSAASIKRLKAGADILLLSSSDAPFRGGWLARFHRQYAPFRSAETGLPMIRASANGPSLWINSDGVITDELTGGYGNYLLNLEKRSTFYGRYDRLLIVAIFCVFLVLSIVSFLSSSRKRGPSSSLLKIGPRFREDDKLTGHLLKLCIIVCFFLFSLAVSFIQWPLSDLQNVLINPPIPDGQARYNQLMKIKMTHPAHRALQAALSVYGVEEVDEKNEAIESHWGEVKDMAARYAFDAQFKENVALESLKSWPIPSLILLKVNSELRPVTMLGWLPDEGIQVFDSLQPGGFVNLSPDELKTYFYREGFWLVPSSLSFSSNSSTSDSR